MVEVTQADIGWATSAAQHLCADADRDSAIRLLADAFARHRIAHQPQPSAEQATVDRIVAFALKEAAERLADECERDSEVITELAAAIQRGDWK